MTLEIFRTRHENFIRHILSTSKTYNFRIEQFLFINLKVISDMQVTVNHPA